MATLAGSSRKGEFRPGTGVISGRRKVRCAFADLRSRRIPRHTQGWHLRRGGDPRRHRGNRCVPALRWPLPLGDQFIANLASLRPAMQALAADATPIPLDQVDLLSPVANPGKLICGMGNWKHHGAPAGMMGFGFKALSALADP